MSLARMSVILITGLPGAGKTTIIKRLTDDLEKRSLRFEGFYTEEERDPTGCRSGFDVKTFDGQQSPLARVGGHSSSDAKLPKVGRYSVYVNNFETLALPIFNTSSNILIVDEVGKMELLSSKFESAITDYIKTLDDKNTRKYLIATIPSRGQFPIVERLKAMKESRTYTITRQNRDNIYDRILRTVLKMTEPPKNKK